MSANDCGAAFGRLGIAASTECSAKRHRNKNDRKDPHAGRGLVGDHFDSVVDDNGTASHGHGRRQRQRCGKDRCKKLFHFPPIGLARRGQTCGSICGDPDVTLGRYAGCY